MNNNFGNKMKDVMSDRNNQIYFGVFVVFLLAGIGAYYFFKAPSTEDSLATETTETVQEDINNSEAGTEGFNSDENSDEDASMTEDMGETTEVTSENSEYSADSTDDANSESATAANEEQAEFAQEGDEASEPVAEEGGDKVLDTINEENQFTSEATEAPEVTVTGTTTVSGNYVIARGDWLSKIAERVYGDMHKWTLIHEMNPQIENPHLIYPGDEIVIESRN